MWKLTFKNNLLKIREEINFWCLMPIALTFSSAKLRREFTLESKKLCELLKLWIIDVWNYSKYFCVSLPYCIEEFTGKVY